MRGSITFFNKKRRQVDVPQQASAKPRVDRRASRREACTVSVDAQPVNQAISQRAKDYEAARQAVWGRILKQLPKSLPALERFEGNFEFYFDDRSKRIDLVLREGHIFHPDGEREPVYADEPRECSLVALSRSQYKALVGSNSQRGLLYQHRALCKIAWVIRKANYVWETPELAAKAFDQVQQRLEAVASIVPDVYKAELSHLQRSNAAIGETERSEVLALIDEVIERAVSLKDEIFKKIDAVLPERKAPENPGFLFSSVWGEEPSQRDYGEALEAFSNWLQFLAAWEQGDGVLKYLQDDEGDIWVQLMDTRYQCLQGLNEDQKAVLLGRNGEPGLLAHAKQIGALLISLDRDRRHFSSETRVMVQVARSRLEGISDKVERISGIARANNSPLWNGFLDLIDRVKGLIQTLCAKFPSAPTCGPGFFVAPSSMPEAPAPGSTNQLIPSVSSQQGAG